MRLLLPSGTCRGSIALYLLWCCVLEELTVSAALSARRGPRTVNVTALSALADDDDLDFDVDAQTPSTRRDDPRARVPALPRPSSAPAGAAGGGGARRGARPVAQQMEMVAPAALGARGTPRRQRQEPHYNSNSAGPPPGPPRSASVEHQDGTLNSTSATSAAAPSDSTSATTGAAASNKKSASAIRAKKYYYASASADSPRASGKKVIGDILFTAADVHEQHPHLERLHQLIQKHRPKYETKELTPSNAYGNSRLGGFLTTPGPATPKIKTVLRKILHLVATDPFEQLAVREEVVGVFNDLRRSLIDDRWFTVVPDYATYLSMKEIEAVLEFFIFLKGSHPIQGPRVSEALRYMFSEAERERERGQKLNGQGRGAGAPSSSSTSSLRSAGVAAPKSTLRGGLRREASVASVASLPVPAGSRGGTEAAAVGGGCHPSSPGGAIRGPTTVERLLMQELYGSTGDDERRTAAPSIPSTSGTGGAFLSARKVETLTARAAAAPGGGGGGGDEAQLARGINVLGDHGNAGGVLGNKTNNTSAASSSSSCSTEESEIDFILSWTRQRKAAIWTKLMTERNWQSLDFRTDRLKRITRVDQRLGTPLDRVTAFLSEVSLYFATVREQEEWAIVVNAEKTKENDEKQKAEAEPPADDMDEGPAVVDQRLAVAALARQNPTTASTTGGVQPLAEQSGNTDAAAALSVYAAPSTAQQHGAMVHAIHTPPPTPEAPNRSPASPSSTHGAGADPRAAAAIQPYRGHAGADHNQPKRQRHSTPSRTAGGASAAGSTATDSHLIRHTTGLGGLFGWPFFQPTAAAHAHRPSPGSTGARSEVGGMGGGIEGMVGGSSAAMPPEGLAGLHI